MSSSALFETTEQQEDFAPVEERVPRKRTYPRKAFVKNFKGHETGEMRLAIYVITLLGLDAVVEPYLESSFALYAQVRRKA